MTDFIDYEYFNSLCVFFSDLLIFPYMIIHFLLAFLVCFLLNNIIVILFHLWYFLFIFRIYIFHILIEITKGMTWVWVHISSFNIVSENLISKQNFWKFSHVDDSVSSYFSLGFSRSLLMEWGRLESWSQLSSFPGNPLINVLKGLSDIWFSFMLLASDGLLLCHWTLDKFLNPCTFHVSVSLMLPSDISSFLKSCFGL